MRGDELSSMVGAASHDLRASQSRAWVVAGPETRTTITALRTHVRLDVLFVKFVWL